MSSHVSLLLNVPIPKADAASLFGKLQTLTQLVLLGHVNNAAHNQLFTIRQAQQALAASDVDDGQIIQANDAVLLIHLAVFK